MKTKIVYKNINIFTVCRPFISNSWTVKSIYRLLSKQWQRRIKNTSCDSILPYFPGNEHFCWLFFFCYTQLVQMQWETSEYLSWIYKEMEGLKDIHIFSYIHSHIHLAHLCLGYNSPESVLNFYEATLLWTFLATKYILKNDRRKENKNWENTQATSTMYLKTYK